MTEDDIYGSKAKYEKFKRDLDLLALKPELRSAGKDHRRKYYCRNPGNLRYFRAFFTKAEARDLSYIRRHRLSQSLRLISFLTAKDLADCTRDDVDDIVRAMHNIYQTAKSKQTFIKDIKYFWKLFFPEKDGQGRLDETIVPYPVRHLSAKTDKSREKLRKDKLTPDEFERLLSYFSDEPRMQAYLSLALESLARPQELLYCHIGDVEVYDNYAKVFISEHGKEGVGLLQCIDSYPYLLRWLEVHPLKKDPHAFLFVNTGNTKRLRQLRPVNINKMIRTACAALAIDKPITCYSLKRSGVTIRRLRGDSDMEIQHAARWASTKQLKTYDLSSQEEAFKRELEKRGLIPTTNGDVLSAKKCEFCGETSGSAEVFCQQCKRPFDRSVVREEVQRRDRETAELRNRVAELTSQLVNLKSDVIASLAEELRQVRPGDRALRPKLPRPRERAVAFAVRDDEG